MGGHCCGLSSKEENSSVKYHQAASSLGDSKTVAESALAAESLIVATKKKGKNGKEEKDKKKEDKDKDKDNKDNRKDNKKAASKERGGSGSKANGGSKHSKHSAAASSVLNANNQQHCSKAKPNGGGSRSKPAATSSMAGSSSYALTSSMAPTRTAVSSISGGQQQTLYTSTNKPYHLNSARPNPLDSIRDDQLLSVGLAGRPLGRDQALKRAKVGGATVSSDFVYQLTSRRMLEKLRRAAGAGADVMTILQEEFAALSPIVPGIYLTGTFGLQKEAFEAAKVWVVVNATTELPLLKLPQLLVVRVPVEDDTAHHIGRYFDDVADLMEAGRRRGTGSVVHCAAGVSRSAALTLAYLLKYTDLSLLEAFRHTRTVRPVIRPNTGFMEQLVEYERRLRGEGRVSVRMLHVTDEKRKVTVYVPDFYQKEYPELYEREVVKMVEINAAAAATSASATQPVSANTCTPTGAGASASSAVSSTSNVGH